MITLGKRGGNSAGCLGFPGNRWFERQAGTAASSPAWSFLFGWPIF